MRLDPIQKFIKKGKSTLRDVLVGVRYVMGDSNILTLEIVVAAVSIFGFGMMTLMPAWASSVLHGDVRTNGWLLSARGVGSLAGALMIAYLGSRNIRGKIWVIGTLLMPICLIIFGTIKNLPVSLIMLVVVGWCFMSVLNTTNAMIQSWVPDELRGRVMSVHILIFMGSAPIGSMLAGTLAEKFGEPTTVLINAGVLLVITWLVLFLRPGMRKLG